MSAHNDLHNINDDEPSLSGYIVPTIAKPVAANAVRRFFFLRCLTGNTNQAVLKSRALGHGYDERARIRAKHARSPFAYGLITRLPNHSNHPWQDST